MGVVSHQTCTARQISTVVIARVALNGRFSSRSLSRTNCGSDSTVRRKPRKGTLRVECALWRRLFSGYCSKRFVCNGAEHGPTTTARPHQAGVESSRAYVADAET